MDQDVDMDQQHGDDDRRMDVGAESMTGAGDAIVKRSPLEIETALEENQYHPFIRALECDLVTDKIVALINFEDMKALSAVSTGCLRAVRKTEKYAERARLIICTNSWKVLDDSVYQWRHISMDIALPVEMVECIEDQLEFAKSITIRLSTEKSDLEVPHHLTKIFKKAKNLHTLELDAFILKYILHDVFSDVRVQTMLTNLQSLAIQSFCNKPSTVCYIDGAEDENFPFQRNFLQLSLLALRLKKFVFGKVLILTGDSESEHVKFIPAIVNATKDTLEELELHLHVWKFEEMEAIRCPKLKRLSLSANGNEKDPKVIKTFLRNQPPLEELVIYMNKEFPFTVLQEIQGVVAKMKKLHIKAKTFSETSVPVDWRFLETMNELKDFRIRKPTSWTDRSYETFGCGEDIITKLPIALEKLSLQGYEQFWQEVQYPVTGNIGVLLARFENLREVNLLRSSNALTDLGLQSIITNCKKLTCLVFSHCPEVTDFGISGYRKSEDGNSEEKEGVSLNDLKGLTRLKIRSCPNVSSDCLLRVVKFDFLRYFDYFRNVVLPRDFLIQIVKQNPSLEEVALHITNYDNDVEYMNQLTAEVKELNPRIHLIKILEQSNWEDEDSDSDASSLHEGGDGDSDFSGGGFRYDQHDHDFDDFDDDYDASPPYFDDEEDDDDF